MGRALRLSAAVLACGWAIALPAADVPPVSPAPQHPAQDVGTAFFGMHFHRRIAEAPAQGTAWPQVAIGAVRLWDAHVRWADLAPSPGQWRFDELDARVESARAHGAQVLYVLGSTPQWASARPDEPCPYGRGCAAEPVRLAHWEEYVRRVATRYRGRICCYELWNEPNFSDLPRDRGRPGFYTGDVATMVEMARIARSVLAETDPGALLTTPGFPNRPDRMDLYFARGGGHYADAIAYHFYAQTTAEWVTQLQNVRAVLQRHGLQARPLWNTEAGVQAWPPGGAPSGWMSLTREQAAARLSQQMVLAAAAGIERFFYYAWDNGRSGMVDAQGRAWPAREAYARTQAWLLGSRIDGCRSGGGRVYECRGVQRGEPFAIVWADGSEPASVAPAPGERMSAGVCALSACAVTADAAASTGVSVSDVPVRMRIEPFHP